MRMAFPAKRARAGKGAVEWGAEFDWAQSMLVYSEEEKGK